MHDFWNVVIISHPVVVKFKCQHSPTIIYTRKPNNEVDFALSVVGFSSNSIVRSTKLLKFEYFIERTYLYNGRKILG